MGERDQTRDRRPNRRRILQGAIAGGAVWTAPAVTRAGTAAAAGSVPRRCPPVDCTKPQPCGPRSNCVLTENIRGRCVCIGAVLPCRACEKDADCPKVGNVQTRCVKVNPNCCSGQPNLRTACEPLCADVP